jgi:hypothetical protein
MFFYLYVIRASRGLRKVGYSVDVEGRRYKLSRNNCIHDYGHGMEIEWTYPHDPTTIAAIEAHAHAVLWDWRVKGEWFNVSLDAAMDAVADALHASGAGALRKRPGSVNRRGAAA